MSLSLCGCKRASDRKLELEKPPFAFIEWFEILFFGRAEIFENSTSGNTTQFLLHFRSWQLKGEAVFR